MDPFASSGDGWPSTAPHRAAVAIGLVLLGVAGDAREPFRALRHEHVFDDLGDGRTRMTDRMAVSAPWGPLGFLVTRALLAPYLRRLLRQRAAHIKRLAETRDG